MVITCENCQSKFNLDENLIKESGSKVRCSNCQHVFTAYRPAVEDEQGVDAGVEEQRAAQPSDQLSEESLDFDLFESEGEDDGEDFSLEDFGLEDESASVAPEGLAAEEPEVSEDQITVQDLGFVEGGSDEAAPEPVAAAVSEETEEADASVEDLVLEENDLSDDFLASTDEGTESEAVAEDEISFEDLSLEEESLEMAEPVAEGEAGTEDEISFDGLSLEEDSVVEEVQPTAEESKAEEEAGEDLAFEDLSLESGVPEEVSSEQEDAEELSAESFEDDDMSFPEGVPVASLEEGDDGEDDMLDEIPPAPIIDEVAKRRRISMPLLAVLIVVLIGGGAYAAFVLLQGNSIQMPFLESLAGVGKSETPDPGNMKISLLEDVIKGGFVDNKQEGRLFVINGKIRSDYSGPRNFIRMKGVLYFKDGKVAKDRIVYSGNILSDSELQTLDRQAINKRLGNRFGDNKLNFKVPKGKTIPFMVVFGDVPEELGEFSVEVVGSVPG